MRDFFDEKVKPLFHLSTFVSLNVPRLTTVDSNEREPKFIVVLCRVYSFRDTWTVVPVRGPKLMRSKNNCYYFQNETRIENVQWEKWKSSKCKFYPWLMTITHQLWVIRNESYLQYQFNKEDMTRCNSQYIADTYTK